MSLNRPQQRAMGCNDSNKQPKPKRTRTLNNSLSFTRGDKRLGVKTTKRTRSTSLMASETVSTSSGKGSRRWFSRIQKRSNTTPASRDTCSLDLSRDVEEEARRKERERAKAEEEELNLGGGGGYVSPFGAPKQKPVAKADDSDWREMMRGAWKQEISSNMKQDKAKWFQEHLETPKTKFVPEEDSRMLNTRTATSHLSEKKKVAKLLADLKKALVAQAQSSHSFGS